jgi:hypothetical protein
VRVVLVVFLLWLAPAIALAVLLGWSYLKDVRAARAMQAGVFRKEGNVASHEQRQTPEYRGPEQDRRGNNEQQLSNADLVAVNLGREAHEIQ